MPLGFCRMKRLTLDKRQGGLVCCITCWTCGVEDTAFYIDLQNDLICDEINYLFPFVYLLYYI